MSYKEEFLKFALDMQVLRFGEFTLKSGRVSPYFFNAGLFNTGKAIAALGKFYAKSIVDSGIKFDVLFGPAYKGIPLAAVTSAFLFEDYGIDVGFAFNRKEAKDHGEGGTVVGHDLAGKILIIDDVISAGTSVRESVDIINEHNAVLAGVVVSLDRQERGNGKLSAIQEIENDLKVPVISIVNLTDLTNFVSNDKDFDDIKLKISQYRSVYGV